MTEPAPLNVHDVITQDTYKFGPGGSPVKLTRVTYYIGKHGPFTKDYPEGQDTVNQMQTDIQAKLLALRQLTTFSPTS